MPFSHHRHHHQKLGYRHYIDLIEVRELTRPIERTLAGNQLQALFTSSIYKHCEMRFANQLVYLWLSEAYWLWAYWFLTRSTLTGYRPFQFVCIQIALRLVILRNFRDFRQFLKRFYQNIASPMKTFV